MNGIQDPPSRFILFLSVFLALFHLGSLRLQLRRSPGVSWSCTTRQALVCFASATGCALYVRVVHFPDVGFSLLTLDPFTQESELVYLIGTPSVVIQHLEKEADKDTLHILDNYLAPTSPGRLSLPCMRGGGPSSEINHDRCKKPAPPDWRPPAPPQTE